MTFHQLVIKIIITLQTNQHLNLPTHNGGTVIDHFLWLSNRWKQVHAVLVWLSKQHIHVERRSVKSQHIHICNIMGLISIFRENKMKKAPLLTSSQLVQIGGEIYISTSLLWRLHTKPPKLAMIITLMIQAYFRRVYIGSSEHNAAYFSSPICTNELSFGKGALFTLSFLNIVAHPIISQI